jgi:hypothetical protein
MRLALALLSASRTSTSWRMRGSSPSNQSQPPLAAAAMIASRLSGSPSWSAAAGASLLGHQRELAGGDLFGGFLVDHIAPLSRHDVFRLDAEVAAALRQNQIGLGDAVDARRGGLRLLMTR